MMTRLRIPNSIADFRELREGGYEYIDKTNLITEFIDGDGVLTGILRVSRESIFSELNNIGVFTLLSREYAECFGFTEPEVAGLLERAGCKHLMQGVRDYYDGYVFGGIEIYNPWSILKFVGSQEKELEPHWLNTSSNALVKELLQ